MISHNLARKLRIMILAACLPIALRADITLYTVSGTTETVAPSVFGFGQVALGDTKDVLFRAKNTGSAAIAITKLAMSGSGFSIVNSATIPFTLSPGSALDFTMRFSGTIVTSYTANLLVNSTQVLLAASVVQAPDLTVALPCTGPDAQRTIAFGKSQQGVAVSCNVTLKNNYTSALNVAPISVTGAEFSTTQASLATIPAGQSVSFAVKFTPGASGAFSGTLAAGARTYTLGGSGLTPALIAPVLTFDNTNASSNEQHTLTMRLPTAASSAASGTVTLAFKPTNTAVADDTAIQFVAAGKRTIPFTITQGSTSALLNGQPSAIFSTGTTAGRITFTVDAGAAGMAGDPTVSINLASLPIALTAASATRRVNDLDITISAFDNTYSAGAMSFAFFDRSGVALGSSIAANFASNFQSFFQAQPTGSAFQMKVTFPVTGDATLIGGVEVTFTNSAGTSKTQRLNFP
jgi:hypothetical protein